MFRKELVNQPLKTAYRFLELLDRMVQVYRPQDHMNMRWIYKDREVMGEWIAKLETADTIEDINDLWREVQNVYRILECSLPDELGAEYRLLVNQFFQDMESVVAESRRMN